MCLDTGRPLKRNEKKPKFGYKVFDLRPGRYEFVHLRYHGEYEVPVGRWLTAERREVAFGNTTEGCYKTGFHVYRTRPAAQMNITINIDSNTIFRLLSIRKIVRVKLAGVHTVGVQEGNGVYVADKMFVPAPKKVRRKKVCA